MIKKMLRLIDEYEMLPNGSLILCAVSGGMDSICLLHLLWTMSLKGNFSLVAAHYNHHLRGDESQRDQAFVQAWCQQRNIPLITGSGPVAETACSQGSGIEETARRMRYEFLQKTAQDLGADRIATAHTADDNAETVLLHLLRGAGMQGLTGIPPRRGNIVRPLLACTHRQIETYCRNHELSYVEDSSNLDDRYTRNFLRLQIIPQLCHINPKAVESISAAAGRLREDAQFLNLLAVEQAKKLAVSDGNTLRIPAKKLAELPSALRARTVRKLLDQSGAGENCTTKRLEDIISLCNSNRPSAQINLPGLIVRREYEDLVFSTEVPVVKTPNPVPVNPNESIRWGNWILSCQEVICPTSSIGNTIYLNAKELYRHLVIRSRKTGDSLKLPGRPRKTLKKLMIETKIPVWQRDSLPVLADDFGVLAVATLGPEEVRLAQPGQLSLKICWKMVADYGN